MPEAFWNMRSDHHLVRKAEAKAWGRKRGWTARRRSYNRTMEPFCPTRALNQLWDKGCSLWENSALFRAKTMRVPNWWHQHPPLIRVPEFQRTSYGFLMAGSGIKLQKQHYTRGRKRRKHRSPALGLRWLGTDLLGACHIAASFTDTFAHVTDLSGEGSICHMGGRIKGRPIKMNLCHTLPCWLPRMWPRSKYKASYTLQINTLQI